MFTQNFRPGYTINSHGQNTPKFTKEVARSHNIKAVWNPGQESWRSLSLRKYFEKTSNDARAHGN